MEDLLSKVFFTQENQPVKNDWSLLIKEDLKQIGLDHLSFKEIRNEKKNSFKKLVKEKCRDLAFKMLLKESEGKSKMKTVRVLEDNFLHCNPKFNQCKQTK